MASYTGCKIYKRICSQNNKGSSKFKRNLNTYQGNGLTGNYNNKPRRHFRTYSEAVSNKLGSTNQKSTTEDNNNVGFFELINDIVGNVTITKAINIIKDTFLKIKNASDGLAKTTIIIEGMIKLFK